MNKIYGFCVGASRLVRQVGSNSELYTRFSLPAVPSVVMGNVVTRHNHNEPPPGSTCTPELAKKARETPDRLSDGEWREVLSSVQYQVTRRHATERAWTGRYNDNKERGG